MVYCCSLCCVAIGGPRADESWACHELSLRSVERRRLWVGRELSQILPQLVWGWVGTVCGLSQVKKAHGKKNLRRTQPLKAWNPPVLGLSQDPPTPKPNLQIHDMYFTERGLEVDMSTMWQGQILFFICFCHVPACWNGQFSVLGLSLWRIPCFGLDGTCVDPGSAKLECNREVLPHTRAHAQKQNNFNMGSNPGFGGCSFPFMSDDPPTNLGRPALQSTN